MVVYDFDRIRIDLQKYKGPIVEFSLLGSNADKLVESTVSHYVLV